MFAREEIALAHTCQGLALYGSDGCLIQSNDRLCELFSMPADRLQAGMGMADVMIAVGFSSRRSKRMQSRIHALLPSANADHVHEESKSGHTFSISTQLVPEGGWVTTFQEATECCKAAIRFEHQALYDTLTGLPNRKQFRLRMKEAIAQMNRGVPFALLILDIDNFGSFNDTLGQAAGDDLLRSLALRMKEQIREVDMIARLDGDEFAILQYRPEVPRDSEVLANRLIEACRHRFVIQGHSVIARLNIGIALGPRDGIDEDEMFKKADLALCRAKQSSVPSYTFFNPELDQQLQSRRTLEKDISDGLARNEFHLHYQPQADAQTGQVKGYEALLRWRHPSRGSISPTKFIPVAEESGLIVPLGEWVLRTACHEAASWPRPLHIAVNLSVLQFQNDGLVELVAGVLNSSGLDGERLELEITESLLLQDNEKNLNTLSRLRELGVRIALDDFGIGYSSLSYLCRFRVDKLKIDRSFVMALPESKSARTIVAAIIKLGESFNIETTAEGVETWQQLDYVRTLGCQEVQGFFIGRPQSAQQPNRVMGSLMLGARSSSLVPDDGFLERPVFQPPS